MTTPSDLPSFGTLAPAPWQAAIMSLTQRLDEGWLPRRLALWLRKPVLLTLGNKSVDVERLGVKLRMTPFDNVSEKRVLFTPQFFDAAELEVLRQRIRPDYQFIDIGANAGLYSLYVAGLAGSQAKIIAVEPQPVMLGRLRQNIALNKFENIHVAAMALADHDGQISLHLDASNRGGASLGGDGEVVEVPCRTLISLMDSCNMQRPDALKIDIEGAEDIVLGHFFTNAPKDRWPGIVFMERNSAKWQSDVLSVLLQRGYRELTPGRMNVILELLR